MLITWMLVLSVLLALGVCALAGSFQSLAWLWVLPVSFAGSFLVLFALAFGFLYFLCSRVDTSVPQEHDDPFYRKVTNVYIAAIVRLLWIKLETRGFEKLPTQGRFVLVCNHIFDLDPVVLYACFPNSQLAFISKRENTTMFIVGKVMHKLMAQLINRENDREALKTILKCIQLLKEDEVSIAVFPEGYTSKSRHLMNFRSGVFKIATKAKVPIVVCTVQGTNKVPGNLKKLHASPVQVHLLDVISPERFQGRTTTDIAAEVHSLMAADLGPDYAPLDTDLNANADNPLTENHTGRRLKMWEDNIQMLDDTLKICEQGYYYFDKKRVDLKLSAEEMKTVRVFLPDELEALKEYREGKHAFRPDGRCNYSCENTDSFTLARKRNESRKHEGGKEILVLNLANPIHPGGGVRRGARAQEEDLCRKSSLLLSLESEAARKYYNYNRQLYSYMGSDAIIITPKVEIIKDEKGKLLPETELVAIMTCAAPIIKMGLEDLTETQYRDLVYNRISGMLCCAAYLGYDALVLGAFGCGAFGNDGRVVSDLFYKVLKELRFDGVGEASLFRSIDFAVLSRDERQYNFQEFYRNFGSNHFYGAEGTVKSTLE